MNMKNPYENIHSGINGNTNNNLNHSYQNINNFSLPSTKIHPNVYVNQINHNQHNIIYNQSHYQSHNNYNLKNNSTKNNPYAVKC